jgi:hypothetical protein
MYSYKKHQTCPAGKSNFNNKLSEPEPSMGAKIDGGKDRRERNKGSSAARAKKGIDRVLFVKFMWT